MTEEQSFVLQGGVSSAAVAILQETVLRMIPYALPSVFLIVLDLVYGIKAARSRGEKVRVSTAVRRTVTKIFSYLCWLILATTVSLAFDHKWLEWVILGLVYVNEFASIIANHLETKGLEVNWKSVNALLFKWGGQKAGLDTNDVDPNGLVRPIQKPKSNPIRNAKGQFVSNKKKK